MRLYEDYAEVRTWFDELKVLRSGRTAYDYLDMLAGLLKALENLLKIWLSYLPMRHMSF
ncbi:MAG: hypothetical protein QXW82_05255 [Candidatus Bathyarchaeia archaeon]